MTDVEVFGLWDAPMTDGARPIAVPTDRECVWCQRPFGLADHGAIMPNGYATHRECQLRNVLGGIGHLVSHERYCHGELGPDAGLGYRRSALLVWRHVVARRPVREPELAAWREREGVTHG